MNKLINQLKIHNLVCEELSKEISINKKAIL